jgi:hypothetical protein
MRADRLDRMRRTFANTSKNLRLINKGALHAYIL